MAKKDYEDSPDKWNVGRDYAGIKVMKLLSDIDEYKRISRYGVYQLEDEFNITDQMRITARTSALDRYKFSLRMLIDNTKFGIKKSHKNNCDDYIKALHMINVSDSWKVRKNKENRVSTVINEIIFDIISNKLDEIHRELLPILNESGFIFQNKEEAYFDQTQII